MLFAVLVDVDERDGLGVVNEPDGGGEAERVQDAADEPAHQPQHAPALHESLYVLERSERECRD